MEEIDQLSLLPDEVLLQIISYSSQPIDFLFWSTGCNKRSSTICRDINLINTIKDRFTKTRFDYRQYGSTFFRIFYLPDQSITRIARYEKYRKYVIHLREKNIDEEIMKCVLLSTWDVTKNVLTVYNKVTVTKDTRDDIETIEPYNYKFSFNTPPQISYICQLENGVPHGSFQHMLSNFTIGFEHGIIQSYKSRDIDVKLNDNDKVDMTVNDRDDNDFMKIVNEIKVVDGIITLFRPPEDNETFYTPDTPFYDVNDLGAQPVEYKLVLRGLKRWVSSFIHKFLIVDVKGEKINMIDSASFIKTSIKELDIYRELGIYKEYVM